MILQISPSQSDKTNAIRDALNRVEQRGGGTVRLLPGLHLSASLRLPSGLTLEICEGATLKALPRLEAMEAVRSPVASRMDVVPWRCFLYAIEARKLTICGGGTIDGSGDAECFRDGIENSPNRPYGFHCIGCHDVSVNSIQWRNSGFWMQRYFNCSKVRISGITVFNHANKNNDGLDIDSCKDVVVEDSDIDSSDDALCIKSEGQAPAENIWVRRCRLSSHASAIKLGTGSIGGFRAIEFEDCQIVPSKAEEMHHPLGLPGGLSAIDLAVVDGGRMENIHIQNIEMEGSQNPIFLRLGLRGSRSVALQGYGDGEDALQGVRSGTTDIAPSKSSIESITFENIRGKNLGPYPIILCGCPGHPLRNIILRDIDLHFSRAGNTNDLKAPKEWNDKGYPMAAMFGTHLPAYGLFTRCIENLRQEGLRLHPAESEPRQPEGNL